MGGPEGAVGTAFLVALAVVAMQAPAVDPPTQSRRAAIMLIAGDMPTLGVEQASRAIEHFVVVKLQGRQQGRALIVYRVVGMMSIPNTDQDISDIFTAFMAATTGNMAALQALIPRYMNYEDMMFRATNPCEAHFLEQMILSALCALGATRPVGKAPRGAGARSLKGGGKGRGK